jgi:hypothetical protein
MDCFASLAMTLRKLPHRNREPAQIGIRHQSHLVPGQFQHGALLVGQHDGPRAVAERQPGTGGAVDAGDVGRAVDVADAAAQHGFEPPNTRP